MHPALIQLVRLRLRGTMRRMLRTMKSPRGIAFSIIGGFVFAVWLGPAVMAMLFREKAQQDPEQILRYGPLILLAICVTNIFSRLGRGALYFTPAEIDFLFPSPVSRLNLLLYKLIGIAAASVGVGVFLGVFLLSGAPWLLAAMLGAILGMSFANLISIAAALVKEHCFQRGAHLFRAVVVLILAVLVGMVFWPLHTMDRELEYSEMFQHVLDAPTIAALLAPLRVFVLAATASDSTTLAQWGGLSVLMNLATFLAIVVLDARNTEAALHGSRKMHARLEQAKRGHALSTWKGAARWRFFQLPRLGGAGSIMWRQCTTALRNSRSLLSFFLLMLALMGFVYFTIHQEDSPIGFAVFIGPTVFFTFFLITMMRFDFRGDLDQLEWLKMLPIPTNSLVIGQLFTPIALLTVVQWLVLGAFASVFGHLPIVMIVACFVVPINIVMVGLENIMFLLYPTRQLAAGFGDLQAVGRNIVLFAVRAFFLVLWAGLGAAAGAAAFFLTGRSTGAMLLASWIVLMLASVLVIPATAAAFRRFDVSVHTPA